MKSKLKINANASLIMNDQFPKKPKNLYECLDLIKAKVPMYIGTNSLYTLATFIYGFETAVWVLGENKNIGEGWPRIILKKTIHNDEEAINEFYRLFDLYKKAFAL